MSRWTGLITTSSGATLSYSSLAAAVMMVAVPMLAFPSVCVAQDGSSPIKVASSLVPNVDTDDNGIGARSEREKSAPQVMAPQAVAPQSQTAPALQAAQTQDLELFNESVKRLKESEVSNPAYALSQYRQFLVGRQITPVVGVQAALKVAQMRQQLKDAQGALLTCDTLGKKYASEPSAALLSLQKARVLMDQKKLVEASQCVHEALPNLLVLGAGHYAEVSTLLLQLAQANLTDGKDGGKRWARALDVDVEQIYLRWLKGGLVSHTWQMFESLKTNYEQVGDQKRAQELLPKAANVLLQIKASPQNPEGADASVMAARWLLRQNNAQDAQTLYDKVPFYQNGFVSQLIVLDQSIYLGTHDRRNAALALLDRKIDDPITRIAALSIKTHILYQGGKWDLAYETNNKIRNELDSITTPNDNIAEYVRASQECIDWIDKWSARGFICSPQEVTVVPDASGFVERNFLLRSFDPIEFVVTSDDPSVTFILDGGRRRRSDNLFSFFSERYLTVRVPSSSTNSKEVTVVIRNTSDNAYKSEIRVHIDPTATIQFSSNGVFFGTVDRNSKINEKSEVISSAKHFSVKHIETSNPVFSAECVQDKKDSTKFNLTISLNSKGYLGLLEGTIYLTTDSPLQPMLRIPCMAYVRE